MTPHETFLAVLQHVIGGALAAANYELEATPHQHMRGLFRFHKKPHYQLEFQHLYHPDIARFRVNLVRNTPAREEQTLPAVMWHHFGARLLPEADFWWMYRQPPALAQELYQAGQFLFAYGIPWLEKHEGI